MRKKLRKLLHNPHPITRTLYIAAGIVLCLVSIVVLWIATTPTPDVESFASRKVSQSTKIYDRTGEIILYDLNKDVRRNIVPLSEISPLIQQAAVAIEDDKFYEHNGVRVISFLRAVLANLGSGSFSQGGSTITQQVVKLTLLTGEKSIIRKLHEWVLAIKLEQHYSKDEILELYLNNTPYGGTLYGIEAASRAFFGKSAKDVTLAEAAYLAALPQSPTYFSPYGNHKSDLTDRKNLVLDRMYILKYIDEETYIDAKSEEVAFLPTRANSIIAPHFVFYVQQYLEEKYGPSVVDYGLSVITTLDVPLQTTAEGIVSNYATTTLPKFGATNAALVAIDPKNGEILTMIGSRDYFDEEIDGNFNVAIANRQPGSSFKPFVYATALEKGYTPQTVIFDVPTQFSTNCSASDVSNSTAPCYAPQNYDSKFRGPMTFTTALAQSINIPAIKVMYLAGLRNVLNMTARLGIDTLGDSSQFGLSLALGAGEVPLLDMVSAYSTFANDGFRFEPVSVLKVTQADGTVLEEHTSQGEQVLDSGVARDISSMLSSNEARFPEYPPNNPFYFPGYDVAAKTGTTNDFRDVWTIGYTPSLAVGVWAGNNDNSAMVKEIAGYIISPMWNAFMQEALTMRPKEFFNEPRPITEDLPDPLRGVYDPNNMHELLYYVDKENPRGGGNSKDDPQFPYWEYSMNIFSGYTGQ